MPYSIRTNDNIVIDGIPDDIAQDSDVLKQKVEQARANRDRTSVSQVAQAESGDPTVLQTGAGIGAEIALGEGSKFGGAAIGTAFFPGIGTAIGYTAGALLGGISGSLARQKIMRPGQPIRYGELVSDTLINFIPAGKAVKGTSTVVRMAKTGAKTGATGAAIGGGGAIVEELIDEGELPTPEDFFKRSVLGLAVGSGLGVSAEGLASAYQKYGGLPASRLDDAFKAGDPDAKIIVDGIEQANSKYLKQVTDNQNDVLNGIDEAVANQFARPLALQDIAGGGQIKPAGPLKVVGDEMDYYQTRVLAESKIAESNQRLFKRLEADNSFLNERSKDLGISGPELSKKVDDYLYAKQAIDYNKQHGERAAGIDTENALGTIKDFESRGFDKQLEASIKSRSDASKKILNVLVGGGLVDEKTASNLRKIYPNYVPLNRVMDELPVDEASRIIGGKYETTGSGIMRAVGSEREVRNITQNIYENLANAVRRVEVNAANVAFKKLIEANPNTTIAKIRTPEISHTIQIKDTSPSAMAKRASGKRVPSINVPVYKTPANNVVTVFEGGKRFNIELQDQRIAAAMRGMNKETAGSLVRLGMGWNRFIGGLYTRFNPEFMIPNLVRDRMEATVNAMDKMKPVQAIRVLNPVADMRTIVRNLAGIKSNNPKDVELDSLYDKFKSDGGSTGGLSMTTVKSVQTQIESLTKNMGKDRGLIVPKLNKIIDGINTVFEDSTRFGTYRRSIDSGMTGNQAALAARNASFDPLLAGTKGDTIKALYLFANPAIQASRNFIRSMRNPKIAAGVLTSLGGLTYSLDKWNQAYDPDWREKINGTSGSNWKTNKNLILVYGTNEDASLKYISLPVGYSMVPFKVLADYSQRLASGEDISTADVAKQVGKEAMDSFNPAGGSIVPTPLRPMFDLYSNKDGLGRDIRPSWLEERNINEVEKVYPWTADTKGGELAMVLAENLSNMGHDVSPENLRYLYQTYTGGPGATVERLLGVTSNLWNRKKIETKDVPIARRFFGNTFAESFEMRTGQRQLIDTLEKEQDTQSAKASRLAYRVVQDFEDAKTPEEKREVIRRMMADGETNNPAVVRRVEEKIKDLARGINYSDNQVKQLGVENMARARFYLETLKNMPSDLRKDYLVEQVDKGILTDEVQRQMVMIPRFQEIVGGKK